MTTQRFILPIGCKPKARPKVPRRGKAYMPPEYVAWKALVAASLRQAGAQMMDGLLEMHLVVCWRGKGRGDADNYAGGVMDAAEGVLFKNDRQVKHPDPWVCHGCASDQFYIEIRELRDDEFPCGKHRTLDEYVAMRQKCGCA